MFYHIFINPLCCHFSAFNPVHLVFLFHVWFYGVSIHSYSQTVSEWKFTVSPVRHTICHRIGPGCHWCHTACFISKQPLSEARWFSISPFFSPEYVGHVWSKRAERVTGTRALMRQGGCRAEAKGSTKKNKCIALKSQVCRCQTDTYTPHPPPTHPPRPFNLWGPSGAWVEGCPRGRPRAGSAWAAPVDLARCWWGGD